MLIRALPLILYGLFVASCSVSQPSGFVNNWRLPSKPVEVHQLLSGSIQGRKIQFQAALSLNDERLLLVGIDGMGRRAFNLRWDSRGIETTKAPWVPENLKPEYILNDIMLVFWPLEQLSHLDVRQDENKRQLWKKEKHIASAHAPLNDIPWEGTYEIENHELDYKLKITSTRSKGGQ